MEIGTVDEPSREARLNTALIAAADTLITDFDVLELLHTLVERCTSIIDIDAGGLMLVDGNGQLQLMTSTSTTADLVEIVQLNADRGPCIDCFTTGTAVSVPNIQHTDGRWPEFQKAAMQNGFFSAHATPLKLHGRVIGTMNLFANKRGALTEHDVAVAQALSDVVTIGILQEQVVRDGNILAAQLNRALDSRILMEQAKGIVSQTVSLTMDQAFAAIRTHARNNNLTIRAVAAGINDRTISIDTITPVARRKVPLA